MKNRVEHEPATRPPIVAASPVSSKVLAKITANLKGNWKISDIEKACEQLGMTCEPPTRGSHYKVSSPHISGALTIPFKRPVKVIYIKLFVSLAEAHIKAGTKNGESHG